MQVPDLSAELAQYEGQDISDAFSKKLDELRASGKLRIPRGGRGGAGRPGGTTTIWDRLRARGQGG